MEYFITTREKKKIIFVVNVVLKHRDTLSLGHVSYIHMNSPSTISGYQLVLLKKNYRKMLGTNKKIYMLYTQELNSTHNHGVFMMLHAGLLVHTHYK